MAIAYPIDGTIAHPEPTLRTSPTIHRKEANYKRVSAQTGILA
jgi:hypothetical protein